MPLTTVTVTIQTWQITGAALPSAKVRFELTTADVQIGGGIITPDPSSVLMDDSGQGSIDLWPNALGTQATQYRVQVEDANGRSQFSGVATIPNSDCFLHDVLNLVPPASVDDAQAAATAAQGYASQAGSIATTATAQAAIATTQAGLATSAAASASDDATATAADRVQTGLDRAATGADRTAAAASAAQAATSATEAAATIAARFVIDAEDGSIDVLQQSDGSVYGKVTNPNDVGYDVILLVGQSNEVGANSDISPTYLDAPDDRIKQYPGNGAYMGKVIPGFDPLFHHQASTGVGHAVTFAKQYLRTIPRNREVLLVPCAHGATGFTTSSLSSPPAGFSADTGGSWDPANGSGGVDLYGFAIQQANAAIALSPNNRIVAILWLQGEADANALTQAQYSAKLDALIAGFRSSITGASNVPFVCSQMVPEGLVTYPTRANINAAHVDTPKRVLRTGFAYGPSGYNHGNAVVDTHYEAAGQRLVGPEAYKAFNRARLNVLGAAPIAPTSVTLAQSGASVTATWVRPYGRYTAWLVEYKVNAGAWTTLSTTTVEKSASITSATYGDTVTVRVSTINEQGTSSPASSSPMTLVAIPAQVTGLAAGTATGSTMPLTWSAVSGAASYLVEYKAHASSTWLTSGTVTAAAATVIGLFPSTSYDFRVTAANAAGSGTTSATATASTAALPCLLDDVGVAAHDAYGLRKLRTAYAGKSIRVRRSSDNTELDIGFSGNDLDTAALLTFAGAGSAFVKTWYDQSGNARDFTQATTTAQPRIVNAGVLDIVTGGRPKMVFDGADDIFIDTNVANLGLYAAGASTFGMVGDLSVPGGTVRRIFTEGGAATTQIYATVSISLLGTPFSTIRVDDSTTLINSVNNSLNSAGLHSQWATDDSFVVHRYLDGSDSGALEYVVARSSKTMTLTRRAIGGLFTSQFIVGGLCEIVNWASALTTGQVAAGYSNQKAYYGTP
jgi:hypothetical protein